MTGSPLQRSALVAALFVLAGAAAATAHEVRPAYWELREVEAGRFAMLWKQPILTDADPTLAFRLPVDPLLPTGCALEDEGLPLRVGDAVVRRSRLLCPGGLEGRELRVAGLEGTLTDVLLRVEPLDGETRSVLLRPAAPSFVFRAEERPRVPTYLRLGVEHMLLGWDHLLFVLGLVLLSRRGWEVVGLVTAFTVAHSITLALTALGAVALPPGPVEVVIALSILFLAVEVLQPPERRTVLARNSWGVAFGFGLLHGCGFAGALAEIGLPSGAAVPALFLFNVGVEIGQLLTVAALLGLLALVRRIQPTGDGAPAEVRFLQVPAAVAMGVVSAFWFVQRFAGLLAG